MRLNLSVLDTDVTDDLPRSPRDRVGSRLWEVDLAVAKEDRLATRIVYLSIRPLGDGLTALSNERVFGVGLLVNGLGVGDMFIVIVQVLLEKVKVPGLETLAPFLHEFELWRDGHCDRVIGG